MTDMATLLRTARMMRNDEAAVEGRMQAQEDDRFGAMAARLEALERSMGEQVLGLKSQVQRLETDNARLQEANLRLTGEASSARGEAMRHSQIAERERSLAEEHRLARAAVELARERERAEAAERARIAPEPRSQVDRYPDTNPEPIEPPGPVLSPLRGGPVAPSGPPQRTHRVRILERDPNGFASAFDVTEQ